MKKPRGFHPVLSLASRNQRSLHERVGHAKLNSAVISGYHNVPLRPFWLRPGMLALLAPIKSSVRQRVGRNPHVGPDTLVHSYLSQYNTARQKGSPSMSKGDQGQSGRPSGSSFPTGRVARNVSLSFRGGDADAGARRRVRARGIDGA